MIHDHRIAWQEAKIFKTKPHYSKCLFAESWFINKESNDIDQGIHTCCIFIDLKNRFDAVDHDHLLQKLEINYGFRGSTLDIMKSYFTNRQQYTETGKKHSTKQNIYCCVQQNCSLGPSLFILFINDLPAALLFSLAFLADDTFVNGLQKLRHS